MVARQTAANAQFILLQIVPDHGLCRLGPPVAAVIIPEPAAFHHKAVAVVDIPFPGLITALHRLIHRADRHIPLDVLGFMQADIRVGRQHHIDGPLSGLCPGGGSLRHHIAIPVTQLP